MYGGQQEHGIRPGTVPVALVVGCGAACELAENNYIQNNEKTRNIKKFVLDTLENMGIEYYLNGDQDYCLSTTVNLCFPGVMSEALMIATKQYCGISNGSACTSKSYAPSYVLVSMGTPEEVIESSVRISWGPDTSFEELEDNFVHMIEVAKQIKS